MWYKLDGMTGYKVLETSVSFEEGKLELVEEKAK